jgi:chromosome segregation ATPase
MRPAPGETAGDEVPEHRARAVLAVEELGRAITGASAALRAIPGEDRKTVILCAGSLDSALADLLSLLETVPVISGVGRLGEKTRESLDRSRAELSGKRAEVASYRAALSHHAETEQQLAESSAEAEGLRDQIVSRERAQRSAQELPGLRRRLRELETAAAALDAADAPEISARLAAATELVAALTEQQRAALSDEAEAVVTRAEAAATELADLRARADRAAADVVSHESDTAQLKAEHETTLTMLVAWGKADGELVDGMRAAIPSAAGSPLDSLRAELSGTAARLTELDAALGPLLAEHDRAYQEARRIRST